jgi:vitamin B12 transporter
VRANSVGFIMKKTFSLRFAASAISISSVACFSQAQVLEVNPVVVSASRVEQPLSKVLSSVSVITREEIEKSQSPTLADLLQGEAGFEFGRNGGVGSTTSFFLRGQNSTSVLIMVDGVRAQTDQIAALTMTDMPLSQIERIEILRGNAGALYGESAIGGVINIQTRQWKSGPAIYGAVSYGTRGTSDVHAGYGGQLDEMKFNLNAGHSGTKGFSSINPSIYSGANPDNDAFRSAYLSGKVEKKLNRDLNVGLRMTVNNSLTEYDNAYGTTTSETNQFKVKRNSAGAYVRTAIFDNWLSNIDFSNSNYQYEDLKNGNLNTTYSVGRYYGEQNLLRWFNTYELAPDTTSTFGVDLNRETFGQSSSYDLARNTNGYFGGLLHKLQKWDFQGNFRTDNVKVTNVKSSGVTANNSTNTNSTLLGTGYQFNDVWRLSATTSSGFRAPSAYEISLSPTLVSETHNSQEIGLSYAVENTFLRTAYFASTTKNAITSNSSYTAYTNIGEVQNKGIEITARTLFAGNSIKANLVSQDPWNATTSTALARRARQYGSLDISRSAQGYTFGTKVYASGQRKNSDYDTVWLGGYSIWSFYASHALNNELTARLRLENAFDHSYQLANGYNTPGRGFYATLQYQPK